MSRLRGFMPKTCLGIKRLIRATIAYVKSHICRGDIKVWSDED